ncbi:MAG: LCP family protein [Thermoleophilia bacterium]
MNGTLAFPANQPKSGHTPDLDNEQTPEQKPYTRYRSSRLRSKKPLKVRGGRGGNREAEPGGRTVGAGGDEAASRGGAADGYDAGQAAGYGGSGGRSGSSAPPGEGRGAPLPRKKRRGGWGKRLGYALLFLLLALLLLGGISYWRLDRAVKASNAKVPSDVRTVLNTPSGDITSTPVNILFLGSDKRPGENSRADTILLMRVNGQTKTISQLSIPRDTLVDIPGYGEDKINSAYAWGGPALTVETVEGLTGLPIHHYVELDFSGFPSIVDSLGGVDIDVPKEIDSQYPQGLEWTQVHFDAGPQHMTGDEALVYVRVRYSDDDFQRMGRQQQFMEALQKKVNSPFSLAKMPLMAPDIVASMTTDISTNDLIKLGWVKFRTPAERNRKFVMVGYGEDIGGISYVVLDEDANQTILREFLAG